WHLPPFDAPGRSASRPAQYRCPVEPANEEIRQSASLPGGILSPTEEARLRGGAQVPTGGLSPRPPGSQPGVDTVRFRDRPLQSGWERTGTEVRRHAASRLCPLAASPPREIGRASCRERG